MNKNTSLTTEQYKKLALGAIYSEQQGAYINSLETGLDMERIKKLLMDWWGIDDNTDAIETLDYLKNKGYSWQAYSNSYLIGRAMWGGKNCHNSGMMVIAKNVLSKPNSPWATMPW